MRTFTGYRPKVPEHYIEGGYGNAPDEAQFQGVEFDDGTVAVRWLTEFRSTSLWSDFATFTAVHGHADYETRIEFGLVPSPVQDKSATGVSDGGNQATHHVTAGITVTSLADPNATPTDSPLLADTS